MLDEQALLALAEEIRLLRRRVEAMERRERAPGVVWLRDGVTAPTAVSGLAALYVDTADGDLKVRYGDAVTKVIVADT